MGMKELQQQTFDVTSCGFGDWILCYFRLTAGLKPPLHADLGLDTFLMTLLYPPLLLEVLSLPLLFENAVLLFSVCIYILAASALSTEGFTLHKQSSAPLLHARKGSSLHPYYLEEQRLGRRI